MGAINLVQHYDVSASQEEVFGKLGDWKWWKNNIVMASSHTRIFQFLYCWMYH